MALALESAGDGPLKGQVDVRDFWVVNEPRLASIVSTTPAGDDRSLNQAVRKAISTRRGSSSNAALPRSTRATAI